MNGERYGDHRGFSVSILFLSKSSIGIINIFQKHGCYKIIMVLIPLRSSISTKVGEFMGDTTQWKERENSPCKRKAPAGAGAPRCAVTYAVSYSS
jgi:hypothetical protein